MFKDDIIKARSLYEADELLDAIKNSENLDAMIYTTVHHSTIKSLAILNFIPEDLVIFHDLDKLVMLLFHDRETVSTEHRRTMPHHDTSTTDENTLIEMMLDWESARLTKPDKPLNAYMTLKKYYPQMTERMMPILKKYNLDKEIESNPLSYQKYEEITKDVIPEMIEKLIISYLRNEPIRFLSDPEYLQGFKDIINKRMNSATKNIFEKLSIGKWTVQFTDATGLDNPTNIIGINNHNKILTIVLEDSDIFLDDELLKNGTQELLQISDNYIEIMYRLTNTDIDIPEKLIFRKI